MSEMFSLPDVIEAVNKFGNEELESIINSTMNVNYRYLSFEESMW